MKIEGKLFEYQLWLQTNWIKTSNISPIRQPSPKFLNILSYIQNKGVMYDFQSESEWKNLFRSDTNCTCLSGTVISLLVIVKILLLLLFFCFYKK